MYADFVIETGINAATGRRSNCFPLASSFQSPRSRTGYVDADGPDDETSKGPNLVVVSVEFVNPESNHRNTLVRYLLLLDVSRVSFSEYPVNVIACRAPSFNINDQDDWDPHPQVAVS